MFGAVRESWREKPTFGKRPKSRRANAPSKLVPPHIPGHGPCRRVGGTFNQMGVSSDRPQTRHKNPTNAQTKVPQRVLATMARRPTAHSTSLQTNATNRRAEWHRETLDINETEARARDGCVGTLPPVGMPTRAGAGIAK